MNKTINQHYVPQFLLNRFAHCVEAHKRKKYEINIFDKNVKKHRIDIVENVFSQKYFYDKDNKVENHLNLLETDTAPVISKLIAKQLDLTEIEVDKLLDFICCQYLRTLAKRDEATHVITEGQMSIVRSLFEANKNVSPFKEMYNTGEVDYGSIEYDKEDKRNISSLNVENSNLKYLSIKDLKLHLLENNTPSEFIIGDHPVVLCNWLLSGYKLTKNIPVNSSPMALGAQLFIPLSPKIYLCLYDANVYKYGSKHKPISDISQESVNWLNSLQVIYANSTIGFLSNQMKANVYSLLNNCENINLRKFISFNNQNYLFNGFTLKNLEPKPNFFKILDKAKTLPNRGIYDDPYSQNKLIHPSRLYRTRLNEVFC